MRYSVFGTRTKDSITYLQQLGTSVEWVLSDGIPPPTNYPKDRQTMKSNSAETLAVAVAAIFAAYTAGTKAEESEVRAFAKVVKALPLADADAMKAFGEGMKKTFGDVHKDAYQYRQNIINNARKVAHGGKSKAGKTIKGKGVPAMCDVLDGAVSMRELKPAMAEAVPASLKPDSGGTRTGSGRKGKGGKAKGDAVSIPKVATREQAFAAARKVLELVGKFLKPSDTKLTDAITQCAELLK